MSSVSRRNRYFVDKRALGPLSAGRWQFRYLPNFALAPGFLYPLM